MKKLWNESDLLILKNEYPSIQSVILAKKLNRSIKSIYSQANLLGLKKTEEFNRSESSGRMRDGEFGKAFRFQKNHKSFNIGKKWDDYMSIEGKAKSLKTTFKKGHLPSNTLQDGIITTRTDSKTKRVYKFIRIALGKWQMLHVYNWEKVNGKLPKGKILAFIGSTDNCSVENLVLITRAENMKRNSIQRYPEEIKQTIRVLTKLKKTINGKK
jgi:hypothetical protein